MLTIQQRMEIRRLALEFIRHAGAPNPVDADKELCDFVDRLADARVVNCMQAALQAYGGIDRAGRAYNPQAIVTHLSNTLEQYALLGKVVAL